MNTEGLRPIGQLNIDELRALVAHLLRPSLLARHIGKVCVVRSEMSGVWCGTMTATDGVGVVLDGARRAVYWRGALTCSGLAASGPDERSTVTAPVTVTITDVVEVIDASDEAIQRWADVPEWVAPEDSRRLQGDRR
ncbi:MAG: hypothetical protein GY772_21750 [bacterium]|nr:hypothetical protein [bacterium]